MDMLDRNRKQLYDKTSTMISNLHLKKMAISQEEMYCLLSILDFVIAKKEAGDILNLLRSWQAGSRNTEIDEIIKATLLQIDFNDPASIQQNQAIIAELISCSTDDRLN